jgi:hypothetical protein
VNKEQIANAMQRIERDKLSTDELFGFIIRNSNENPNISRVDYNEVVAVFNGLYHYFKKKSEEGSPA